MLGDPTPLIKPEYHERFRTGLRAAANFFKHAQRDAAATYFFSPEASKLFLIDACAIYREKAHEELPLITAFELYVAIHDPALFKPAYVSKLQSADRFQHFQQLSKRTFFSEVLPAVTTPGWAP